MHIITKRRLREFAALHAQARPSLTTWARVTTTATWSTCAETRASWPSVDLVGHLTVFNVGGNRYRLIAFIDYRSHKVFIRAILTHAEYDRGDWKHDDWY